MSKSNALGLRRMAQWYRDGQRFSPAIGCGCFYDAMDAARTFSISMRALHEIVGVGSYFGENELYRGGWTDPECTDDAIAVLEMAADLEECEETP